jgi:hypothetical protein
LHVLRGSGAPLATFMHWPGEFGRLQEWQVSAQAFSQQTPSTHWPDPHSPEPPQGCPFCRLPQTLLVTPSEVCCTHLFGDAQSESSTQFFTHALAAQMKGEQSTSWESRQVP